MPRIDAPTVAEHHDLHLAKLLDAALAFVATDEVESLTLAALAKRTGRSRASLYVYFDSTDDLRAALCIHVLESWVGELLAEVRQVSRPDDRLDRFVAAQIDHRHDPSVDRVLAFVVAQQSEPFRERVGQVTEPMAAELHSIIGQLGVEPPTRASTVVQGAVAAAHDQVRAGADARQVAHDTIVFVRAGLAALGRTAPPSDPRAGSADHEVAGEGSSVAAPAPGAPGALSRSLGPSMPALFAAALPAAGAHPADRGADPSPIRTRATTVSVAQLGWAVAAFASGLTGAGGSALHLVLGLSLVAIVVWSVRVLEPGRATSKGRRAIVALAVAASAVALIARVVHLDGAVVAHVVLASMLLVGLWWTARTAWRGERAVSLAHGI